MKKIISDKLPRILKNKKKLEKVLDVKITNRGKEVFISGDSMDEYVAEKTIDAINLGFPISVALAIKEDDFVLETINIKEYTRRSDLSRIRARIIGKNGKTLKTLKELTNCFFEINGNIVGIAGYADEIRTAQNAIISIIQGAKQSNVYSYLEKHRPEPILDFGLKK